MVEHLRLAGRVARKWARAVPHLADEFESAAMLGLVDAASKFDAAFGVRFETFAPVRIEGAVKDAARMMLPKGFRRNKDAAPVVGNAVIHADEGEEEAVALLSSGELPVGWEEESLEEVDRLTRGLTGDERRAVALYFGGAGMNKKRIGELMGLSESRVSQLTTEAVEWLKYKFSLVGG